MLTIEAGCGEIIVQVSGLEARQTIKVVLSPLPHVPIHIIEPHGGGGEHIHRLQRERERV